MIKNLMSMLGGSAGANVVNNANQYAQAPDNTFDPLGFGGALGGAALGGLGGYFGGRTLANKYSRGSATTARELMLNNKDVASKLSPKQLSTIKDSLPEVGELGKLTKGKGALADLIAKNPKLLAGGGAAIGAMLGSQLLGNALTQQTHEQTASQMQAYAQKDAQDQQRNLMALSQPYQVRY